MIFKDFQGFSSQNEPKPKIPVFMVMFGRVWRVSSKKNQEINTRNEELSMSRCAQYILKFSNFENSESYGFLKSVAFSEKS